MPYQITLLPSGRRFEAQAGETLLAAARRQQVRLPQDCGSGACGVCRARLVSGAVRYPEGPPLGLTAAEQQAGSVRVCRAVAESDLLLEVRELGLAAASRIKTLPCRVAELRPLGAEVMALYLKLPAVERLRFLPGQYIDVLLPDGERRSFSLANPPEEDARLELHVGRVPGGRFSRQVFAQLRPGALLEIEGPLGAFFLREDSARPILMVAGGTGFAPFQSMLRHLFATAPRREVALYWGARESAGLYARQALSDWAARRPEFRFVAVLSEPEAGWRGRTGLVHEAMLADAPALAASDIYLAGPPAMVAAGRQALLARGADPQRLFSDPFDYAADARAAQTQSTAI